MTRTILFGFGIIVIVVSLLFAALWYSEQHMPNNVHDALFQYTQFRYATLLPIMQFAHATMPTRFTREMSGMTFGNSHYFGTTINYRATPAVNLSIFATATASLDSVRVDWMPGRPIPFPPADIWCVALEDEGQPQVVLVAEHQDLYNADWIIHVPAAEQNTPQLKAMLATVGCNLKLGQ